MEIPQPIRQTIDRLRESEPELIEAATYHPSQTFEPLSEQDAPSGLAAMRELRNRIGDKRSLRLEMGSTLGQGGMGVVHLATQLTMGRQVAVKGLQKNYRHEHAVLKLLQEAWITGTLEHPNVAPVYDIEVDPDGLPEIVMKRIEGVDWGKLMFDAETLRVRFDQRPGEWNLRVLMQVCAATHFAHSRGILHRDLKPENVMIGEFGEVYVLDWGLALGLRDDGSGRYPLASQARKFAGTPCYMAPEMLQGGKVPIDERTDVYLLGAILYEILRGRPPHKGTFEEMVVSAYHSSFSYPETAPQELKDICQRATAPNPPDRYPTADALRLALQAYLEHSGSRRLANEARQRLGELRRGLHETNADGPEARRALYNLYGECSFGFKQAVRAWSENTAALSGQAELAETMIDYELGRGDPAAAAVILEAWPHVPESLRERVTAATEEAEREQRRVEELARRAQGMQLDREGARARTLRAAAIGVLWTLFPLGQALFGSPLGDSHWPPMISLSGFGLLIGGVTIVLRRHGIQEIDLRILRSAALAMTASVLLHVAGIAAGATVEQVVQAYPLGWFIVSATLVINVDWRLLPMSVGFVFLLFFGIRHPEWVYYGIAVQNLMMTLNIIYVWRPRLSDTATPLPGL